MTKQYIFVLEYKCEIWLSATNKKRRNEKHQVMCSV